MRGPARSDLFLNETGLDALAAISFKTFASPQTYHHHHAHSKSQVKVSGGDSKLQSIWDDDILHPYMRKPMEHANMCSKLSVLDQGRIKTCASLSRPLQVTVRSILQQTFYSYYGRSGPFLEIIFQANNVSYRHLEGLFESYAELISCYYISCYTLKLKRLHIYLIFIIIITDFLRECHLGNIICLFLIILTHDHAHICIHIRTYIFKPTHII